MKKQNIKFVFFALAATIIFLTASAAHAEETATSTPEITSPETEETETATSTPEIILPETVETPTSTATSTLESATVPGPLVNFFLRYQNTFLFSGPVTSTATSSLYDSTGLSHAVSASSSPLIVLVDADALSDNFSISQLDYYDSYQSFYLNCLAITAPTSTAACGNWNYAVNGNYPSMGLDSYALHDNDTVYIYFGDSWKITASTSTFPTNTTTTLSTWRYNYDNLEDELALDPNDTIDISVQNPNPTGWWDATITTTTLASNASGTIEYAFSTTGTYFAKITSTDYSKWSWPITLTILPAPETPTSTATSTPETGADANNPGGDGGSSGGGNGSGSSNPPAPAVSSSVIAEKTQSILNFLKKQQEADGKIIDGGTTDWAIMSFSADSQYAQDIAATSTSLLDFAKDYNFTDASDLNACASYPRHVLALLAAGVSGTDASIQNLIIKIKSEECYKNNQFGQNGINDDVFALFSLLAVDTPANEPVVADILATIITDQTADGAFTWAGWPSADITGAAINALQYARNKGLVIDQNIITKARAYLKSQQLADGGWGFGASDALTTSWAMMGINALQEGQTDWTNNQNKNPWSVLTEQLKTNGYYESAWAPGTVDWFGTKHAVPALLGKSWPIILASKPQPVAAPASSGGGGGVGGTIYLPPATETASSTALSTLPIAATSTPAITTSTLSIIPEIAPTPALSTEATGENVLPPASNPDIIKTPKLSPAPPTPTQPTPAPAEITETPPVDIATTPPAPPSPLAPLEKKVATTTAASSAILFAGTTLLLFGRLLLTIL